MTTIEDEIDAEIASLCELHGVAAVSPTIRARVRAEVIRRHRTRDTAMRRGAGGDPVEPLDETTATDPDWQQSPGQRAFDDAPRFRPDLSERERLPRTVSAEEQRAKYDDLPTEPRVHFGPQGESEGVVGAIRRVNAANAKIYGLTGEPEGEHLEFLSARGEDPTATRLSFPPRRDHTNWVAENAMGGFDRPEPAPLRQTPNGYPRGPSVNLPPPIEVFGTNYGAASPNVGDPDRWTQQRGARPDRFSPLPAGVSADGAQLRRWNNWNRRHYGDAPIRTALPAPQKAERSTEANSFHVRVLP